MTLKFIPVRGRKLAQRKIAERNKQLVEIYPREGTETPYLLITSIFFLVEIYPREGTETNIKIRFNVFVKLKFIPVRGRKPEAGFRMNFASC